MEGADESFSLILVWIQGSDDQCTELWTFLSTWLQYFSHSPVALQINKHTDFLTYCILEIQCYLYSGASRLFTIYCKVKKSALWKKENVIVTKDYI